MRREFGFAGVCDGLAAMGNLCRYLQLESAAVIRQVDEGQLRIFALVREHEAVDDFVRVKVVKYDFESGPELSRRFAFADVVDVVAARVALLVTIPVTEGCFVFVIYFPV
jgi:hypothetical protein